MQVRVVVKQARRYAGQLVNTEVNLITSTLYMEQSHYFCTLQLYDSKKANPKIMHKSNKTML